MSDRPCDPDRGAADDTGTASDRGSSPGTPLWVKVFGIIVIALLLSVALVVLTGVGGPHGPQRHAPAGDQHAGTHCRITAS